MSITNLLPTHGQVTDSFNFRSLLIRGFHDSHPEHVDMVGHQTKNRACESVPEQRMSEQFTESIKKSSVEPASQSFGQESSSSSELSRVPDKPPHQGV